MMQIKFLFLNLLNEAIGDYSFQVWTRWPIHTGAVLKGGGLKEIPKERGTA